MKRTGPRATATRRLIELFPGLIDAGGFNHGAILNRLAFLVVFIGAKVVALVGMLLLARLAAPDVFGGVELALSVALIVAGVGLLGVPGGATRLALAMDEPRVADILAFAAICIAAPATAAAVVGLILGWPSIWVLVLASCAAACFQVATTTYARIRALRFVNSLSDPFAVLAMLALAAVLWLAGVLTLANLALAATGLACLLCLVLVAGFLRARRPGFLVAYPRALAVSLPILALSGVSMIVGVGLRPLLGTTFPLEQLAVYSLCFRLCAPCMLIHQLVGTAFFARLYRASDRNFDRVTAAMVAGCTVCVIGLWLVLQPLIELAFPTYVTQIGILAPLFPLVGLQVTIWIVNALLEMKVGRHDVAHQAAFLGYGVFGVFFAIFVLGAARTMSQATLMFDAALIVFALGQIALLLRRQIRLPLSAGAIVLTAAACVFMSLGS